MPTQQRPRGNKACAARGTGQVTGGCCEQGPIGRPEFRPRDLAAENLELVPQHQQLNVFHMQPAAATNQRTEQGPKSEIEERKDHAADPPSPRVTER